MRAKWKSRQLSMAALILMAVQAFAQTSIVGHGGGTGFYLGWNAAANQTLEVKNEANEPILWFTDNLHRMKLEATQNPVIGSFALMPTDGFLAISPNSSFWNNGDKTPFTRLHLAEGSGDNAQSLGYRPWMRNGVTFTGNADQGYVGHKYAFIDPQDHTSGEGEDTTDMVIQWSDNPGKALKDRLRFIFTSQYSGTDNDGANSLEGLEAMRFFPEDAKEVNVGVGDFFAANLADATYVIEPTERIDMVNGRLRIRDLPTDSEPEGAFKIMVVDDAAYPSNQRGVVKPMDLTDILPADCEWTLAPGSGAGTNHESTAFGTAVDECPDDTEAVGIGIDLASNSPTAKTMVRTDVLSTGLDVEQTTSDGTTTGLHVYATGGTSTNNGGLIEAQSPSASTGLNYGLFVTATGAVQRSRAVHGETSGAAQTAYAGEFISNDGSSTGVGAIGQSNAATTFRVGVLGRGIGAATYTMGVSGRGEPALTATGFPPPGYVGVSGIANGANETTGVYAIGVYGQAPDTDSSATIRSWAGFFNGDVSIQGDCKLPRSSADHSWV